MKKTFLAAVCAVFAAVALNSCFGEKANKRVVDILDAIPADATMVGVADFKLIMNSAGVELNGAEIILPTYIKNEIPGNDLNEFEELQEELERMGLDISTGAMFADLSGRKERMFFVLPLLDEKKYTKYMEDEEEELAEVENGVTYFYSNASWSNEIRIESVVNDGYVYILENSRYFENLDEAIETLEPMVAASNSYRSTKQGAMILESNAAGFAFTVPKALVREMRSEDVPSSIANALEGVYLVTNMNLSDDKLISSGAVYSADNKPLSLNDIIGDEIPGLAFSKGIDSKLLEYLPSNTIATYALNVEGTNWEELFDWFADITRMSRSDRGALTMATSYLNKLGGNIAIGAGYEGGLKELGELANGEANPNDVFTIGAVVQTQPDGAKGVMKDLSGALDMAEIPYDEITDGICVTIPNLGNIYAIAVKNDIIAISNEKITGAERNAVSRFNFGEQILSCAFVADKDHKILKDLDINYGLEMFGGWTANPLRCDGEIRITDNSDNLVTSLLKSILSIAQNAEKIEDTYFDRQYVYDYDNDYDYDYAEEAVEDITEPAVSIDDYPYAADSVAYAY